MIKKFLDFDDDTLYIFDFDDTIVDSPRFEELAIKYLKEDVTIKGLLKNSVNLIDKKIEDLKIEHGRLYIDDPNFEINIKGNWVRKKSRVYLIAPDKFYYSNISFPNKLTNLSILYKSVKNKAIVTARNKTLENQVKKYLNELGLEYPNVGLFMYPIKDSSKVADWKAKTVVNIIKKTGFKKVNFYDDKSKIVNAVEKLVKSELPNIEFKGFKVKSIEMSYLKENIKKFEELDFFRQFIKKYDKSGYLSKSDSNKLSEEGIVTERIFRKLEKDINKCITILNKIDLDDVEYFLKEVDTDVDFNGSISMGKIKTTLIINTKGKSLFTGLDEFEISYSKEDTNLTLLNKIVEEIYRLQNNKRDDYKNKISRNDYFSRLVYTSFISSNNFEYIKIIPTISIKIEMLGGSTTSETIQNVSVFIENSVKRLFSIENINNTFTVKSNYSHKTFWEIEGVNSMVRIDIDDRFYNESKKINLHTEEIKDYFQEIIDEFDLELLDDSEFQYVNINGIFYQIYEIKESTYIQLFFNDDYFNKYESMKNDINLFIERLSSIGYKTEKYNLTIVYNRSERNKFYSFKLKIDPKNNI